MIEDMGLLERDITRDRERLVPEGDRPARGAGTRSAAVVSFDFACMVRAWDATAESMFGWTEQEVLGRRPAFIPDERHEDFARLVERVFDGELTPATEWLCHRRDGRTVAVRLTGAPARALDGRVCRALIRISPEAV